MVSPVTVAGTDVRDISDHPEGKMVTVSVGRPGGPKPTREARARVRAIRAAGIVPSIVNTVRDVTRGQMTRLTRQEEMEEVKDGITEHKVLVLTKSATAEDVMSESLKESQRP